MLATKEPIRSATPLPRRHRPARGSGQKGREVAGRGAASIRSPVRPGSQDLHGVARPAH